MAHFPALGTELTEDELRRLRDKFRYRGIHGGGVGGGGGVRDGEESSSDVSFRRWFWSVVGSGSTVSHEKNDAEAVSLSDLAMCNVSERASKRGTHHVGRWSLV